MKPRPPTCLAEPVSSSPEFNGVPSRPIALIPGIPAFSRHAGLGLPESPAVGADRWHFRRQWVILRDGDDLPSGWQRHCFPSGSVLCWHPDLLVEIQMKAGEERAILGLLVELTGEKEDDEMALSTSGDSFCRWLVQSVGTYAVIRHVDGATRIYTDPGAMMGVYHRQGRASSSPRLLPGLERDPEIDAMFTLDRDNDWFTGSICPFKGVRFLPANHWLDLSSGDIGRFWPLAPPAALPWQEAVDRCASLVRRSIEGAVARGRTIVSLTGGKDSRVNLAGARRVLDRVHFFTVGDEWTPRCDRTIPLALALRFPAVSHRFIGVPVAEDWMTECYDEISGGLAVGARRGMLGACHEASRECDIHVSGALGEMARAYFWHAKHPMEVRLDTVLAKFGNPAACISAGLAEWLERVPPEMTAGATYNLLYLEQRGARWAGVGENACSLFYQPFTPFNSRLFFEALCAVPEEIQYEGRLPGEIIDRLWPELLNVPFCRTGKKLSAMLPKSVKSAIRRLVSQRSKVMRHR